MGFIIHDIRTRAETRYPQIRDLIKTLPSCKKLKGTYMKNEYIDNIKNIFHELIGKLSIEELISNSELIEVIKSFEKKFRIQEAAV